MDFIVALSTDFDWCDSISGSSLAGSLTGAVHLSNDNAGVLR